LLSLTVVCVVAVAVLVSLTEAPATEASPGSLTQPRKEPLMLTCPKAVEEAVNVKTNRPEIIAPKRRDFFMPSPSRKSGNTENGLQIREGGIVPHAAEYTRRKSNQWS
jgi:hypothetical protein